MRWALGLGLSLAIASPLLAQSAREEGKALGEAAGRAATDLANDEAAAARNLPGYNFGDAPEKAYLRDPAALEAAKPAIARTNEASVLAIDGAAIRPVVPQAQINETTARGNIINTDPSTYVRGVDPNGNTGTCVELPPSSTLSPGNYEATCNVGAKVINEPRTCAVPLAVTAASKHVFDYTCGEEQFRGIRACDPNFTPKIGSACTVTATRQQFICRQGTTNNCTEPDWITINTLECDVPVPGEVVPVPREVTVVTAVKNETICAAATQGLTCTNPIEVCTDSDPVTRIVNNVPVTQACWKWDRTYDCQGITQGNTDCGALEANRQCTYLRTDCLDDPQVGACKVDQKVFNCPIPGGVPGPPQTVCGGDVYCIGGDCEAVTREASDEFKDAAVGLHALGQAAKEFDQADYRLFKGTGESCSKPVFGLANCCGGNGIPIIGECSAQERQLAVKIDKGFVHYVGTYCSNSFLGICTSKRRTYCSFSSKLTRILQQQGRPQIGKTWGPVRTPDCSGFTADEFSRLDLSTMDFAEIYQDFVTAARLPYEAATMADIQARIRAYYAARGR